MTLILGALAHSTAVLVGDQRLTLLSGGAPINNAVKLILFNNHMVFGYTGVSTLPRSKRVRVERSQPREIIPSNLWLAEVLALGHDPGHALDVLREEAERIPRNFAEVGIGFVGIGWTNFTPGARLEAVAVLASNLNDARTFDVRGLRLAPKDRYLLVSSSPLPPRLDADLHRQLKRASKTSNPTWALAQLLRQAVNSLSTSSGPVGGGVLEVAIPRLCLQRAIADGELLLANTEPGDPTHLTLRHLPRAGESQRDVGPTWVAGGLVAGELHLDPAGAPLTVQMTLTA